MMQVKKSRNFSQFSILQPNYASYKKNIQNQSCRELNFLSAVSDQIFSRTHSSVSICKKQFLTIFMIFQSSISRLLWYQIQPKTIHLCTKSCRSHCKNFNSIGQILLELSRHQKMEKKKKNNEKYPYRTHQWTFFFQKKVVH